MAERPKSQFFNRRHRFRVWRWRYVYRKQLVKIGIAVASVVMGLSAASERNPVGIAAGVVFVLLSIWSIRDLLQPRDRVQAAMLWKAFSRANKYFLDNSGGTRFTVFRPSIVDSDVLVPWYRFQKGGQGAIKEAQKSRARFKEGEGTAGSVWKSRKEDWVFSRPDREFGTRAQFDQYCIDKLELPKDVVSDLSDHMIPVRYIFAQLILTDDDKLLGVLTIDSISPLERTESESGEPTADTPGVDCLNFAVESVRVVLTSLENLDVQED